MIVLPFGALLCTAAAVAVALAASVCSCRSSPAHPSPRCLSRCCLARRTHSHGGHPPMPAGSGATLWPPPLLPPGLCHTSKTQQPHRAAVYEPSRPKGVGASHQSRARCPQTDAASHYLAACHCTRVLPYPCPGQAAPLPSAPPCVTGCCLLSCLPLSRLLDVMC